MKMLMLRFTKLNNVEGDWWDSNLIILNGPSGVHIEMPGTGNSATTMQSMTGMKFVSNYQDYFGEVWDKDIPHIGFGQVIKFRVRKLPDYAVVVGDIEDGGELTQIIQMISQMLLLVKKKNTSVVITQNCYWERIK